MGSELRHGQIAYAESDVRSILPVLAEGIEWMRRHFLAVPDLSQPGGNGWLVLTRWGRDFDTGRDLPRVKLKAALPDSLLHEKVKSASMDIYLTGRFEAAVFEAFKLVEIAVRDAANFSETDYGTDMIAKAFNPDKGPLTDSSRAEAERKGLMGLNVWGTCRLQEPAQPS